MTSANGGVLTSAEELEVGTDTTGSELTIVVSRRKDLTDCTETGAPESLAFALTAKFSMWCTCCLSLKGPDLQESLRSGWYVRLHLGWFFVIKADVMMCLITPQIRRGSRQRHSRIYC